MKVFVYDMVQVMSQWSGKRVDCPANNQALIIGDNKILLVEKSGDFSVHKKKGFLILGCVIDQSVTKIPIKNFMIDAVPVDDVDIGIYLSCAGKEKLALLSDAMVTIGAGKLSML